MAVFKTTNSGISGSSPYKNSMIGKWETPIRMIIQNESDICAKNDDLAKANRPAHTSIRRSRYMPILRLLLFLRMRFA